jgi:hypothetical protein
MLTVRDDDDYDYDDDYVYACHHALKACGGTGGKFAVNPGFKLTWTLIFCLMPPQMYVPLDRKPSGLQSWSCPCHGEEKFAVLSEICHQTSGRRISFVTDVSLLALQCYACRLCQTVLVLPPVHNIGVS